MPLEIYFMRYTMMGANTLLFLLLFLQNFVVKFDTEANSNEQASSRPRVCLIDFGLVMEFRVLDTYEDDEYLGFIGEFVN